MSDDLIENRSLGERLNDPYRVKVVDEENLREVRSFRTSGMQLIMLGTLGFLLLSALIVSLIFFTPIKRLVPGFGDIKENREFVELTKQVNILKDELNTQQVYTQGLMKMLSSGDLSEVKITQTLASKIEIDSSSKNVQSSAQEVSSAYVESNANVKDLSRLIFAAPVQGSISAGYDLAINHRGIDILAAKDTPVKSIAEGIVMSSDWTLETGNTIAIQHNDNLVSFYKHNSALLKKTGDYVTAGEAIAIIGNTGTLSDGPHLHFEVWYHGKPIDPELILSFD